MVSSQRYPKALCNAHYEECLDAEGNKVTFCNIDFSGGFMSQHFVNDILIRTAEEKVCFVRGIKCVAQEARFGGIVLQTTT